MPQASTEKSVCRHCSAELSDQQKLNHLDFCCNGCEIVYQSIQALGLGKYYEMRGESRSDLQGHITPLEHHRYADDPLFRQRFCAIISADSWRMTVNLEGIHCAACIWLLERLPSIVKGLLQARVRFADNQIDFLFDSSCSCAALLSEIERLGYRGKPIEIDGDNSVQSSAVRHHLIRIGVAAICSLNTMMLAVSLYQGDYSGMETGYRNLLQWYSFALTLPTVLYAALPFYRTAFGGLRAGILHIDLPIVIALLTAFAVSSFKTFTGGSGVYFDSVTTVVFLLLSARYLQSRVVGRIAGQGALLAAIIPISARRIDSSGAQKAIYSGAVSTGDRLRYSAGDVVSADGIIDEGTSLMSLAFLTGESLPIQASTGSIAYAGSKLVEGEITIRVTSTGTRTRVGKILLDVSRSVTQRPGIELFLDRRSKTFTAVVVCGALGTGLFWSSISTEMALERTIAFLLVACPCVLALATPIVFSVSLIQAARRGILLRSTEVIERLERISQIFLDKTGTVTVGEMRVQGVWQAAGGWSESPASLGLKYQELLVTMEHGIEHPVAGALRKFIQMAQPIPPLSHQEPRIIPGSGISLERADGFQALLGSPAWTKIEPLLNGPARSVVESESRSGSTVVAYVPDPEELFLFSIADSLRPESLRVIEKLKAGGFHCSLISGDLADTAQTVARQLGVSESDCYAPCTPEQKQTLIQKHSTSHACAMVGDGINDAAALAAAHVGIGVAGGAESALKVADVYLGGDGIGQLPLLLVGAKSVMHSVRISLIISGIYNVAGAAAAFWGYIGPLEAAILMPLSSLSSIILAASRRPFKD